MRVNTQPNAPVRNISLPERVETQTSAITTYEAIKCPCEIRGREQWRVLESAIAVDNELIHVFANEDCSLTDDATVVVANIIIVILSRGNPSQT
jgi:hypothetical protein